MTDPIIDPKSQWKTIQTDENTEWQIAFWWSDDFFDDPNFLSKIWQWNTSAKIDENENDDNLWDIGNIFKQDADLSSDNTVTDNSNAIDNKEIYQEKPILDEKSIESDELDFETEKKDIKNLDSTEETPELFLDEDKDITNHEKTENQTIEDATVENKLIWEDEDEDSVTNKDTDNKNENNSRDEEIEINAENEDLSDFVKKFIVLKKILIEVYDARKVLGNQNLNFETVWSNSDRSKIIYHFALENDEKVSIEKTEINKETLEETKHKLFLELQDANLIVWMDDIVIFEEEKDLTKDPKKKLQVMEKINKFIFLAWEYQNSIQMEMIEKIEEEKEKKKMQDIFRNF